MCVRSYKIVNYIIIKRILTVYSAEDLRSHLMHLLHESERRVHELGSSLRINDVEQPFSSSSSNNIPAITVGDSVQCKTFSLWERRTKGLRNMLLGLEQISTRIIITHSYSV